MDFDDLFDDAGEWDHANNPGTDDAEIAEALRETADPSGRRAAASSLSAISAQMASYPVITDPDEQFALLTCYLDGLRAQLMLSRPNARRSQARAEQLRRAIIAGNDAGNRLTASLFRLTRKIAMEQATRRFGRARALDMLDDLIADAHLALVESFTSYDRSRCPTFALYAGKVIRTTITNRVQESSDNSHLTPPASWLRTKRWALPLLAEKAHEYRRELTHDETVTVLTEQAMLWAYDRLTDEQRALPDEERDALMHAKLIKQGTIGAIRNWDLIVQYSSAAASLDSHFGDDGEGRTLHDTVADTSDAESDFDSAELSALHRDLLKALDSFGERDKNIILHRFGFVDGHYWTFAELEPRFSLSAERIRQVEQKVLAALAGPSFTHLGLYLPGREDDGDLSRERPEAS